MGDTYRSRASLWDSLQRLPGARVFAEALKAGERHHAKDMAASIAYFSFFSLFPLLVGIVAGASFFVNPDEIASRLDELLADELPGSAAFVRTNIEALIEMRGPAGLASLIGLLWAGSKMFGALSRGLNLALGSPSTQPFVRAKLRYFGMTVLVFLLAFVAAAVSMALEVLLRFDLVWLGRLAPHARALSGHVTSFALVTGALILIYRMVPRDKPSLSALLPAALVAAVLFELAKTLFVLYLEHVGNFEAVYGSLSSVIVLLLWLYFSARVLLLGAALTAVRQTALSEP